MSAFALAFILSSSSRMQLPSLSMKSMDLRQVAKEVYDFASSQAPLAPLVKEALGVIDDAIECFGYASLQQHAKAAG